MDDSDRPSTPNPPVLPERRPPSLKRLDTTPRVSRQEYERSLPELQKRLKEITLAYRTRGARAVVVFEGVDAAGKGGTIRRISGPLDPRALKVWPIAAPSSEEKAHHYLHRFWKRLPRSGQLVIFDRSWYGRVLVERVEGFAAEAEWKRAYAEINEFERMLDADGIRFVKIFLHITPDVQLQRFRARYLNPLKQWKLSEEDLRNRARWPDYATAIEEMFEKTSTVACPWTLVPGNNKKYARLASIQAIISRLGRGVDLALPELDPELDRRLRRVLFGEPRRQERSDPSPSAASAESRRP